MTIRVIADSASQFVQCFGITYRPTAGTVLDVPDSHAEVLIANGWNKGGDVHVANVRPAKPAKGATFLDTALGFNIKFDGKVWRNPLNGVQV